MINKKILKAFTLVELLVVIAIVGILSGLIIVGMNNSVQQANIAKAQIFSASLRDSLLANLVSEWKLDGDSNDVWGSNNCTWSGSGGGANTSASWRSASDCVYGQCLNLDGTDDYLDCGTGSSLNVSKITIDFWFKPTNTIDSSLASHTGILGKSDSGTNSGYMAEFRAAGAGNMAFYLGGGGASFYSCWSSTNNWKAGQWYNIVYTYDGSTGKLYNNANRENNCSLALTSIQGSSNSLKIGKDDIQVNRFLPLTFDNFRIYNAAMSTSQVREQYYAGLNRLLIGGNISNKEYSLRINNLIK